ncbi:MAG: hypothetical protein QF676_09260 [Dehalococcoidia bacterium]|nr:hypothetical protein [Chloroflexota bacterium]MDP7262768.1 hypothetical protein [Dehalococcoidia bacterium]MDP7485804.1 hypothetical protein [Dehalococcoidia bacterium]
MPKNSRKNRRTSKPNVFVQSRKPADDNDAQTAVVSSSADATPRTRARVERTTQRASVRSEIYTRSLSAEIKKMGALTGLLVIALVVLTFAL